MRKSLMIGSVLVVALAVATGVMACHCDGDAQATKQAAKESSYCSKSAAPALSHSRAVRLPAVLTIENKSVPRRESVTNGNTCGLTWLTMK